MAKSLIDKTRCSDFSGTAGFCFCTDSSLILHESKAAHSQSLPLEGGGDEVDEGSPRLQGSLTHRKYTDGCFRQRNGQKRPLDDIPRPFLYGPFASFFGPAKEEPVFSERFA